MTAPQNTAPQNTAPQNAPQKTALVIGATGSFGRAAAETLLAHGWRVKALHRDPERARSDTGLSAQWIKGDAMRREDVVRAADGVQAIVHAANPPGYKNWGGLVLPMMENTIVAAGREGARILVPGNVYNFGPDARGEVAEDAPQHPKTRKGRIRALMEQRLRQASQEGVKSVVLRAGDFFGPRAGSSWMSIGVVQGGKPLRAITYPGPAGVRHAWAYLPDLAETAAQLLDREADLATCAGFHFRGHAITGAELAAAFERVAGRRLPVRPFPWFAVQAVAPFNETFRELLEMRYLWREDLVLDNARLTAVLGAEPHTPIEAALTTTLRALGCLEEPPVRKAA